MSAHISKADRVMIKKNGFVTQDEGLQKIDGARTGTFSSVSITASPTLVIESEGI